MKIQRLICLAFFIPVVTGAQNFTDVTPGNIPGMDSGDIAWADYNNDGYLDFAMMGISTTGLTSGIYTGNGNGTFALLASHNLPRMRSGDLDWGDFDNDGDLDLALIGETTSAPFEITVIMRNNITSFEQVFTTDGSEAGTLTWLDYDNDRDLDLYQVGSFFNNFYPNTVFINSDGQFSTDNVFHVKGYSSDLTIDMTACLATDFDRDGDQDILVSGKYGHGTWSKASLLVNNGVMNIENIEKYRFSYNDLATRTGSISQGDFNKDGLMDYVITGNSSSISSQDIPFSQLLLGTGDGYFSRRGRLLDVYTSSTDVGDIDADGDLDVIISGLTSTGPLTRLFLNNGLGSFTDSGITDLVGLSFCTVTLADYDNDGDLDILIAGRNSANVKTTKLYRNNLLTHAITPEPNEKPVAPSNLTFRMENNTLILEWDKGNDKETPQGSLTYNVYVAIASGKPFKLFPQAIAETGERLVYDHGNASVNTNWSLKNLKTGNYSFSVQSIDGANEGSDFASEVSFSYVRIDAVGSTCINSEQVFSVSPEAPYVWTISGGEILEGQGTGTLHVKWNNEVINPKITASASNASNSFIPDVKPLPPAAILGPAKVCDLDDYVEYRPVVYSENLSYRWNFDGAEYTSPTPFFEWTSPGSKQVNLTTTDLTTGCTNSQQMQVAVSEYLNIEVEVDAEGYYTLRNASHSYTYTWERYVLNNWSSVSINESFKPEFTGYYRLTVTNEFECSYMREFFVEEIITSLGKQPEEIKLAPNPASTSFQIINVPQTGDAVNISVLDLAGRTVLNTSTLGNTIEINCSSLQRGMYVVLMQAGRKVRYSKIMIE